MILSGRAPVERWRPLSQALALSLLVHLLPAAAVARWWAGAASEATPAGHASPLVAALAPLARPDSLPAGKIAATRGASAAERRPETPDDAEAVAARGEHKLLAEPPPYIVPPDQPSPPDDRWYFPRAQLTVAPLLVDEPSIDWPPAQPGDAPTFGTIVVRVLVGFDGAVDRVEPAGGDLPPAYQESAAAAFARARFVPGEIAGVAVDSEVRFEVVFDSRERWMGR